MTRYIASIVLAACLSAFMACSAAKKPSGPIQPCAEAGVQRLPIVSECAAAAIAERAFLEATHNEEKKYLIFPMDHEAARWYFMIVIGDKQNPPPPGGHFMISVERSTGKTEVTPGA
jgi:hypothetical protein